MPGHFKQLYLNSSYFIKFICAFCILYFGTKLVIGLTVPGGYYSPFIAHFFDYPALLRLSLLQGTRLLAAVFGFNTFIRNMYTLTMVNGSGVHLVYSCLGYGLLSFWIAFVFANEGGFLRKLKWIITGCFFIWLINVIRITLVLISSNQHWKLPATMEQHTLFNIAVYVAIFCMIWLFSRSDKKRAADNPVYKNSDDQNVTNSIIK